MIESALAEAHMTVLGRVPGASNAVFLCLLEGEFGTGPTVRRGIYKPVRGERPLHDFPAGTLARREVAAYRLAHHLGIDEVPPTVFLDDGPLGPGSLQAYVLSDGSDEPPVTICLPSELPDGWLPAAAGETETGEQVVIAHSPDEQVLRLAVFDIVANNADRKGSHILSGAWDPLAEAQFFGIDNGLTFHTEPKLRTILWGFDGVPVPGDLCEALDSIAGAVPAELSELLTPDESRALALRAGHLAGNGTMPSMPQDRIPIPWPPV
ncbi:SCO1664 family protein [Brevibacterium ravenspurgense]|uniref:SCO1664 family protein n=1 Tax=Brevibacterium ravenspurgense TaxID=479117 RepID=UPI001EF17319|nr:SCO1664 family protein [Brevibacterium ravenspurgense]